MMLKQKIRWTVLKCAQYRGIQSFDHKQGNGYPNYALRTIYLFLWRPISREPILCARSRSDQPVCLTYLFFSWHETISPRHSVGEVSLADRNLITRPISGVKLKLWHGRHIRRKSTLSPDFSRCAVLLNA